MKRRSILTGLLILFIITTLILLCYICFLFGHSGLQTTNTRFSLEEMTDEERDTLYSLVINKLSSQNSGLLIINHPVEERFIKESSQSSGSTGEQLILFDKYALLWKEEINKYSSLIREELEDESLVEAFDGLLEDRKNAIGAEMDFHLEREVTVGLVGSQLGPNISLFQMSLYREWAIELIQYYDHIMQGRGWGWTYSWGKEAGTGNG